MPEAIAPIVFGIAPLLWFSPQEPVDPPEDTSVSTDPVAGRRPAAGDHLYLDAALEVAAWLEAVAIETENGVRWPVALEGERRTSPDLYDGAPGVLLFLLEAHHQTERSELLALARAAADDLTARLHGEEDALASGLYVGVSGLAFSLLEAWEATGEVRYRDAAERVLDLLTERAIETESGLEWNESTDLISGGAGIGLFLLHAARVLERPDAQLLARRAGDRLIALGQDRQGGMDWEMAPDSARRMPNFSHGTAGVGHFLAELWRATGEDRYLVTARAAAGRLRAIAEPQEAGGSLIRHHEPLAEDLYYLGWCHGPAGTVRFLRGLAFSTQDEEWRALADELVGGLHGSGIPVARPAGFWNNVGFCCGNAGVADLLLELHRVDGEEDHLSLANTLLADALVRGQRQEIGRSWTHAEHRTRPEELSTQTGYMQGAAGIGMVLLRAHAHETGTGRRIVLPDESLPTIAETGDGGRVSRR